MVYEVEMWAFRDAGKIRRVTVPDDEKQNPDQIYKYGQNDFQPQRMRSVSCGDVVRFEGKRLMVMSVGFQEIAADFVPNTNDPLLGYRSLA